MEKWEEEARGALGLDVVLGGRGREQGLEVVCFRFTDELDRLIGESELVISHAG